MKKLFLSILFLSFLGFSFSQERTIDLQNTRPGENVEYCITHKIRNAAIQNNPELIQSFAEDEAIRQQELTNQKNTTKATILYIPVVFHILHNGGPENISDEQVYSALDILNRDFDALNSDLSSVVSQFQGVIGDADIQFRLATIAPDGTCFKGITRTQDPITNNGSGASGGSNQVDAIKAGNDVYQGEWPGNKYLNIFVVNDAGGAAGYTTNPNNSWTGTSMKNGIWILHGYVGEIGTSNVTTSRSLTHEVGHWLNLSHTWGPNNNPGSSSSCSSDDGVNDTPLCIGLTSCNLNANTCSAVDPYYGIDQIDNTENYMEYSYCSKMFTAQQVTRMRNALASSVGGRNNVVSASNLAQTGADGNYYLCKAEFSADRTSLCVGDSINFKDESYNAVSGWTWTFQGGSPSTSTQQNPTVTYNTPGLYEVTLVATDGTNSDTETKTQYIRVLPQPNTLPFLEDFEGYSTLNNIEEWEIKNEGGNGFELETTTGHTGTKCVRLNNLNEGNGNVDYLISTPVDLSSISGSVTLSFRYAYKRTSTSDQDWLRVKITNDCGLNWATRKTLYGFTLGGSNTQTSAFTPSSPSDWTTVHVTNITSSYWVSNFRYMFEFQAGGGNNFYLDNINIYNGSPSEELVVGLEENEELKDIVLYPNPAEDEINVSFSTKNPMSSIVSIQDITGKRLKSFVIQANVGTNLVNIKTAEFASGIYFLKIYSGSTEKIIKFIIK